MNESTKSRCVNLFMEDTTMQDNNCVCSCAASRDQPIVQSPVSRAPVSVGQIVTEFLRMNGYDGLHDGDECACDLDCLFPCGTTNYDCFAGYKTPCDCGDHDFHISSSRG